MSRSDSWAEVAAGLAQTLTAQDGAGAQEGPRTRQAPSGFSRQVLQGMAAALPADAGIMAYLRQLDLDLMLLTGPLAPASPASDYRLAAQRLRIPCAPLTASLEGVPAQTQRPSAVGGPGAAALIWTPALWGARIWDALTRTPEEEAATASGVGRPAPRGLRAQMEAVYAGRIFPELAGLAARLAPASRPILKARLVAELDHPWLSAELSAEAALVRAAEGDGPVVFGPWTGDPDLELLYWVPFLRWARRRFKIDKERVIVISRGGAGGWYEGLGTYLDLSELFDPEALAALEQARVQELARRGKKFGLTEPDRQIFRRLDRRLGFRGFSVLPPWAMHLLFERYWSGQAGPAFIAEHTRFAPLKLKEKKIRQLCPGLPARYLAMGFEGGSSFPDRTETRAFASELVRRAARRIEVAVVGGDGWLEAAVGEAAGVHWIGLDPVQAQAVGSAVMAGAEAYVGAQTWLAYAASAFGRPAVWVQSEPDLRQLAHRTAAALAFQPAPVVIDMTQPGAIDRALAWALPSQGVPAQQQIDERSPNLDICAP